jgi:hypothetical protein
VRLDGRAGGHAGPAKRRQDLTLVVGDARNNGWPQMIVSGLGCRLRRDEGDTRRQPSVGAGI